MTRKRRIYARFVVDARDDDDVCALSHEAFRLWWSAILWCRDKGNDGFVPEHMLGGVAPPVKAIPKARAELVSAGFLITDELDGKPGWQIKNYSDYQDTKAVIDARKTASIVANLAQGKVTGSDTDSVTEPVTGSVPQNGRVR